MNDTIPHEVLTDPDIIQEAHNLQIGLVEIIDSSDRYEQAILIALAKRFANECDQMDICPFDTLCQILDADECGLLEPVTPEFVHAEHDTLQ